MSAGARSRARCRTSRRWAPAPGEAYLALGVCPTVGEERALELMRGAEELAAATGTVIAGGDVVVGAGAYRLRHGRRLGGLRERARRARRRAARRPRRGDRPARRQAAPPAPAPGRGPGAGAGRRARDDRPLRRARHRRRHLGERSGVCLEIELEALPLAEGVPELRAGARRAGRRLRAVLLRRARGPRARGGRPARGRRRAGHLDRPGATVAGSAPARRCWYETRRAGASVRLQGFEHRW